MKTSAILLLGVAFMAIATSADGQSLKDRMKTLGNRIEKTIEKNVENKVVKKTTNQAEKVVKKTTGAVTPNRKVNNINTRKENSTTARQRQSASENTYQVQNTPSVRLPQEHTALFAPLGYDIEARFGVKSIKPVLPPDDAAKQVDWVDKMPYIDEMDNQSLVDEYLMLKQCLEDGYIVHLSPAGHRYDQVSGEVYARANEFNGMVTNYNEILDAYNNSDSQEWEAKEFERRLAAILENDIYKRTIRSSIAPFFKLKDNFVEERTRTYFAAHGGYENAHRAKWTHWDPNPNKKGIDTSSPGQTGVVADENESGATVDVGGIIYVLHYGKSIKGGYAFASEAVKTAVDGKDIVIPEYINYNGRKFPVTSMRSKLFYGTKIRSVKLPNTLTELPNSAFRNTPITEIVIPASVKALKGSVFNECTKLTKVTFEGDYMKEFSGSFRNCTSLVSIVCPRRVDMMSYDMFSGCINLTSIVLPENLTEIPSNTFENCTKLKKVDIPSTVKKIGALAFAGCSVTELDLRNVTEFDEFCFDSCKTLKKVILSSSLKDEFLKETYVHFMECPNLQVKYVNNSYVIPEGFVFVP